MKSIHTLAALAAALTAAGHAGAVTITFDEPGIVAGATVIFDQYAALGAIFSANAFSGAGSSTSGMGWATRTDMTVVSSTGPDVSSMGTPVLVSGNVLHSFTSWGSTEDGDASFLITFTTPVNFFSATFAGVSVPADTRIFLYNGTTQLSIVNAASPGLTLPAQVTLSASFPSITSVVVAPGSFVDWVGVDNIVFTPAASAVPEPATYGAMLLGLGLMGWLRRRRQD